MGGSRLGMQSIPPASLLVNRALKELRDSSPANTTAQGWKLTLLLLSVHAQAAWGEPVHGAMPGRGMLLPGEGRTDSAEGGCAQNTSHVHRRQKLAFSAPHLPVCLPSAGQRGLSWPRARSDSLNVQDGAAHVGSGLHSLPRALPMLAPGCSEQGPGGAPSLPF